MIKDISKYVLKNFLTNLTRSSLTIVSITIGIMAIFALLSFGQGLTKYVDDIAEDMGVDNIIVMGRGYPFVSPEDSLTNEDVDFLKNLGRVYNVAPFMGNIVEVQREEGGQRRYITLAAMSTKPGELEFSQRMYAEFAVEEGRDLQRNARGEAVIGHNYRIPGKVFDRPLEVGDRIFINGESFRIVGFFPPIGNPQDDTSVIISIADAEELFGIENQYQMVYLRGHEGDPPKEVADYVQEELRRFKNEDVGEESFTVQTFESLFEMFDQIFALINGIVVALASISIFVAAVNIANSMYTSVLERTKEIGIMKALGARNSYIASIFMAEAGLLGLIGGALGVLLGYIIATIGGNIVDAAGYGMLSPYFPLWLIIGCLLFAFTVGSLSGFFPALQASRLKPVDALREE